MDTVEMKETEWNVVCSKLDYLCAYYMSDELAAHPTAQLEILVVLFKEMIKHADLPVRPYMRAIHRTMYNKYKYLKMAIDHPNE